MNVLLSIKPQFADAILSGEKKFEFRKRVFKKEVERIYLYSTAPVQKIVGFITFSAIIEDSPSTLWDRFGREGGITKEGFFQYFKTGEKGYAICIDRVERFPRPIDPYQINGFTPPQSYCYCGDIAG